MTVFCDDLDHNVNVGGGQTLLYTYAPVTHDGLGNPLTMNQSWKMGEIANLGLADYRSGNQAGATGAQAAIWGVEYGVTVTSTDTGIEHYINLYEGLNVTGATHYANGLFAPGGTQGQIIGTPEVPTWLMLMMGFGALGYASMRHAKRVRVSYDRLG